MGAMSGSVQQPGEESLSGGAGLRGDFAGGGAADLRERLADEGDVGGFGKGLAVGTGQAVRIVRECGGQVGGIGLDQEKAVGRGGGVIAGAPGVGADQGAAERNVDVFCGEGGEGVGRAGVGVDEEPGGMGRHAQQDVQHLAPGVAAVQAGGEGEFAGKVELGAEDRFAVGVEAVFHAAVEADFANAGGARGQGLAEVMQPARGAVGDEPRVQAEGAEEESGMGVGEAEDGGPVGFGGGGDVDVAQSGGAGASKDAGQMGGEPGVLEMAVGVEPREFLAVRGARRCYAHGLMVIGRTIRVNSQRAATVVLAGLWLALAAGCSTSSHYPTGMEQTTLGPLRRGDKTNYEHNFGKRTKGRDGVLFGLEKGRVAQLEGDYAISKAAFEGAMAAMREQDEKAVVSASGAAAQSGAILVNDKAIPYRAPSYERTLAHHYQALNYLATDDWTGAGVEVRRANREQEEAARRREREIERAASKNKNVSPDEERDPHLLVVYAGLDEVAGSVKHSFQNAATFYLSATIWEMLGEPNSAYIDYKRALEIAPENPYAQRDVVRLGKRLGMREDVADFSRRFPDAADVPADRTGELAGKARLVVLYEEGLVPQKTEMAVAYPLSGDAIGVVALPVYAQAPPPPMPLAATLSGKALGQTAPICSVAALAARALGEQMPGILTRQVARAIAKGVGAKAAKDAGGDLGALAASIYNVLSEQADLRSWLTLPAHVHVLGAWVPPGERTLALAKPGGGPVWSGKVTLREGKTTLVVVTRIDLAVYSKVIVQP